MNCLKTSYYEEAFLEDLKYHVGRPVTRKVIAADMGLSLPAFDQKIQRARRKGLLLPGRPGSRHFTIEFPR